MEEKRVRTRFAPSPTGFLHIGSLRTAAYAWLLAKHHGGDFILRIEDTDRARKVDGAVKTLVQDLAWFGITPDEGPSKEDLAAIGEDWEEFEGYQGQKGPYVQSQRLSRYQEVAEKLIELGVAYRCDCSTEKLAKDREEQQAKKEQPGYNGFCRDRNVSSGTPHVVRLKMDDTAQLKMMDGVKGLIRWASISLRDPVLLKRDGFPTYHLAVVVDDHDMEISHVLRGDEWISSAPIHILLYQHLGWELPVFAHLPVVLGKDGKKLSKRHGSTFISNFQEAGYLPEALLNFVVLIGWSPGDGTDQELFTLDELKEIFSLDKVNKASGIFDYSKLDWMNGVYIRDLSDADFLDRVKQLVGDADWKLDQAAWDILAPHVRERCKLLPDVIPMIEFINQEVIEREMSKMFKKGMDQDIAQKVCQLAIEKLGSLQQFSPENIEATMREIPEMLDFKVGPVFGVVRIAVTGKMVSPPLFESLAALGKERVLKRLEETVVILSY